MLYVTTPYLIVDLYRKREQLQRHLPACREATPITNLSSTAGSTDLLVTWLYKLTIDKQYYNVGAVIGIHDLYHTGSGRVVYLPQQQIL